LEFVLCIILVSLVCLDYFAKQFTDQLDDRLFSCNCLIFSTINYDQIM